jgi:hypothetical protein
MVFLWVTQTKHNMIDDFSKYKFFYVNGSSHTEGGGLEHPEIRHDSFRPAYEKYYNVTWKHVNEVNWGARLSEILKIPVINEAKSGGGPMRSIRMTYDFIHKNWNKRDEFFIILENPDASRCDVYHKKTNSYFIVNTDANDEKLLNASRDYWNKNNRDEDNNLRDVFDNWVNNHYSLMNESNQNEKALIGLYCFCKLNGIKIFVTHNTYSFCPNVINNNDIVFFEKKDYDDIYNFCVRFKLRIFDEINKFGVKTHDNHPGYFGHIEYAKKLAKFLGWPNDLPNWPDYQSFETI